MQHCGDDCLRRMTSDVSRVASLGTRLIAVDSCGSIFHLWYLWLWSINVVVTVDWYDEADQTHWVVCKSLTIFIISNKVWLQFLRKSGL
ncbi:hypothetical protein Tco_0719490 [Tanacetum coccineum]